MLEVIARDRPAARLRTRQTFLVMPTPLAPSHLLIAEPHGDTRALYRQALTEHGASIAEAADGREALVHALARVPTLIVAELSLPFIDGVELCEILRRDRHTAHVPFVAVTAEARLEHAERAKKAGADAVLIKPVSIDTVVATVLRLVEDCRNLTARMQVLTQRMNAVQQQSMSLVAETRSLVRSARKSYTRTSTFEPAEPSPSLLCPDCARLLTYVETEYGGVSARHAERWDQLVCQTGCGRFEYRFRTKALRRLT
jgi:two-component system cell cycle response regulator DivK